MTDRKILRVIVADDEPLARQRLEDLLAKERDVEIRAMTSTVPLTIAAIRLHDPDILFLDVQMPGGSGLDVAREIGPEHMPVTIFVTAFDQYALRAFDLAAVDYLLKPFDDERFGQAFRRARHAVELEEAERTAEQLRTLLESSERQPAEAETQQQYLERIAVESRGQVRVVPADRIDYITASGPYAELHVGERVHTIRERMQTLEEKLDPAKFFRIHRSAIVQLDRIDALLHHGGGDYAVRLKSGVELSLSRAKRDELEAKLRS